MFTPVTTISLIFSSTLGYFLTGGLKNNNYNAQAKLKMAGRHRHGRIDWTTKLPSEVLGRDQRWDLRRTNDRFMSRTVLVGADRVWSTRDLDELRLRARTVFYWRRRAGRQKDVGRRRSVTQVRHQSLWSSRLIAVHITEIPTE